VPRPLAAVLADVNQSSALLPARAYYEYSLMCGEPIAAAAAHQHAVLHAYDLYKLCTRKYTNIFTILQCTKFFGSFLRRDK